MAAEILAEARIDGPPVDAFVVAKRLGIVVARDDRQSGRARYVRLCDRGSRRPRATILLRHEPRYERRHWAIAHEIGEHVAYRVFLELAVDPRETAANARELVANQMAGRILLPTAWFWADAAVYGWDLAALKAALWHGQSRADCASHVGVSAHRDHQHIRPAAALLASQQSAGPGAAAIAYGNGLLARGPRAAAPVHASAGSQVVHGWPVHEEGWWREILRTEVEEIADFAGCDLVLE